MSRKETLPLCPACRSTNVTTITYGLPLIQMDDEPEDDDRVYGGCIFDLDSPPWACRDCETRFGSMDKAYDLSRPFIGLRTDVNGGPYDRTLGEYLVNPLSKALTKVTTDTGGFFSDERTVISGDGNKNSGLTVPSGGYLRIGLSTEDEFDELTIGWTIEYTLLRTRIRERFHAGRMFSDTIGMKEIPFLGSGGRVVSRLCQTPGSAIG